MFGASEVAVVTFDVAVGNFDVSDANIDVLYASVAGQMGFAVACLDVVVSETLDLALANNESSKACIDVTVSDFFDAEDLPKAAGACIDVIVAGHCLDAAANSDL